MGIPVRSGLWVMLLCTFVFQLATAAVEDSFDYFVNNWNVIGLPDYMYGSLELPCRKRNCVVRYLSLGSQGKECGDSVSLC